MYKIENHKISEAARVNTHADEATYMRLYQQSIEQPDEFWAEQAKRFLDWDQPWSKVHESDMTKGEAAWFIDGKLNVSTNCIDRHLATRADQIAIIWEGDDPSDSRNITYRELHEQVCRLANVLKARGVKKGDRVCLYMPMIPEAAYAMLACARIGAVHSVVFGGFSPDAVRDRILNADCRAVITADESVRAAKRVSLKQNVDKALTECPDVHTVITVQRTGGDIDWNAQHGHHLINPERLLFFNNGGLQETSRTGVAPTSLAVELQLDLEQMTATRVWTYDGGLFSQTLGDVQRLANGNTLVTYSNAGVLHEVDPQGELLQTWEFPDGIGYASHRTSLYGPPDVP